MLSYWKVFSLTGDLDTYLLHKENERYSDEEEYLDDIVNHEGEM